MCALQFPVSVAIELFINDYLFAASFCPEATVTLSTFCVISEQFQFRHYGSLFSINLGSYSH